MPKKSSKKPRKDKVESAAHYAGVMLEGIRDQVQLVAEAVQTTREVLESRIGSVDQRLSGEIDDLKTGMRMLNQKVDGVENRLGTRIDRVETRIDQVEENLSGKIGRIGVRLDQHEGEIIELKKVQNLA